MAAHAINKQSFEFSCNSETVAVSVRYEIEHYTAFHINNIISSTLDEYDEDEITYSIDRLEINLGDVQLKEFGNAEMLDKFKAILNEKLSAVYKEKKYFDYYRNRFAYKNEKLINETSNDETDFKLLEVFLLRGDIPWWGDKNTE